MPSVKSAEGKARQRARNAEIAEAAGLKPTRSGSSGINTRLLDMERKTWEEMEFGAEHIADVGCLLQNSQITAAGTMTMQIGMPLEYLRDAAEVALAASMGALYIRFYAVTPGSLARAAGEPDDDDE